MSKNDDPNFVIKLEKAISSRWGDEAIKNPKSFWNPEKEKNHQEEAKKFYKRKFFHDSQNSKEKYKGFLVSKKLLNRENKRDCPVCKKYSFSAKDDLYMSKFECCFECYVNYVENREERWKTGWRPNSERK